MMELLLECDENKNCFSVQYHPEASPGPHDSSYLFDQFIENERLIFYNL
jgi:carbamoyl-phosphate synthase small subunit